MGSEGPDTDFRAFSLNNRYLVFWQRESEFKLSTFFFYSQSAFYAFSFFHSSNGTCCSVTRFFTSLLLQRTFSHMQPFLCFIASILFRCHVWISCLDAQANQLWQADSLICNADGGGDDKQKTDEIWHWQLQRMGPISEQHNIVLLKDPAFLKDWKWHFKKPQQCK